MTDQHKASITSCNTHKNSISSCLDLPGIRLRSNSCSGLPGDQQQLRASCLGAADLNASNSALDCLPSQTFAKDPFLESSLAIRKLSQAFGEEI
ncbi:unnamed protein product [Meloidogyne enterolobii]|uniref:Uncharacterized protein n=1 Tax=Meloidogyne enterolobii TaxID=390850 RepID=A0ACB0ZNA6_MELEN